MEEIEMKKETRTFGHSMESTDDDVMFVHSEKQQRRNFVEQKSILGAGKSSDYQGMEPMALLLQLERWIVCQCPNGFEIRVLSI